ncbi:MAG: helix-turn-helix domain-containing protein [Acidobacteria bacterium]|nr:helix-turn-helix domain-containing protein [Acidobacteriota bacterium]
MSEHSIELEGATVSARRRVERGAGGLVWIDEEMTVEGRYAGLVVMGRGWLFELHDLSRGSFAFVQDGARVPVKPRRFGLLYAPFSITEVSMEDVRTRWVGVAASGEPPRDGSAAPHKIDARTPPAGGGRSLLFEVDGSAPTRDPREVLELLASARVLGTLERSTRPSPLSLRAKRLIASSYDSASSIASVAARLGVTHAHLARQFKRDCGMTPHAYRARLRASDALLRLTRGEKIADVSGGVGYNDLGRFYKQFRKLMHASPGTCRLA